MCAGEGSGKWIKVKDGKTLLEALQHKDYIIPAIPGLFLQSLYNFTFLHVKCMVFGEKNSHLSTCSVLCCFKEVHLLFRVQGWKLVFTVKLQYGSVQHTWKMLLRGTMDMIRKQKPANYSSLYGFRCSFRE